MYLYDLQAEGDEKQVLEDRKAALVADMEAKKVRLDELNRVSLERRRPFEGSFLGP